MNTERTPYGAEEGESDDSAAVSFGSGPAFRPIPRIERPAAPEPKPETPQRVTVPEGLLFSRAQETIQASQVAAEKKSEDDDETDEDEPTVQPTVAAPPKQAAKPARQPSEVLPSTPGTSAEGVVLEQQEAQLDQHIPDLGEFTTTLPEVPPVPEIQAVQPGVEHVPAEQHAALPPTENEPLSHAYPAETAADLPEWPEEPGETPDPPLQPTPPRTKPAASLHGQFEAPPSNVIDADESNVNYAAATAASGTGQGHGTSAGGGGGGRPPVPPPGSTGGMAPGSQPPNKHNAYFTMQGYNANIVGGGYGGGYNPNGPNGAPNPNAQPQPRQEVIQNVIQKKKGNIWPYVAVLGENIARKRADRKLKKEMSARMDQQEQVQEVNSANQLRLERQQQEMLSEQRKQAVGEAHQPSGNEWGVPRSAATGTIPGQRMPGERAPMSATPGTMGERVVPAQAAELQMEQPAELANQPAGRERHSAWHTYYEDEKGRQIAGVEYGTGFKQEQKEIVRDHAGDDVVAGVAGAASVAGARAGGSGGVAGGAAGGGGPSGAYYGYDQGAQQSYQPQQYQQPSLPSGMTTPGLPAGASQANPQHQLPEHTKKSSLPGPLFWLMVGLIIFAFFAAALI